MSDRVGELFDKLKAMSGVTAEQALAAVGEKRTDGSESG
jgi:hypothetical protein